MFEVITTVEIEEQTVVDLLVTAFDSNYGSTHYWVGKLGTQYPSHNQHVNFFRLPVEGGAIKVYEFDEDTSELGPEITLDCEACQQGLEIMAADFRKHFQDILNDNADGETADVFVQLALFGTIVYG